MIKLKEMFPETILYCFIMLLYINIVLLVPIYEFVVYITIIIASIYGYCYRMYHEGV